MSAALAAAPALHARDVPPTDLNPAERAAWWHSQCNKLGAEVAIIEAVRDDHRTLDQAADRLDAQVRMPDGESMRDRLERLDAETRRATSDAARRRSNDEHVALYARYVRRMDQLVAQDATLQSRGVRSFAQMNAQLEAAERRWKSQQSRHPLARAERDAACEEDRRALAEADRLASQFAPRPRSSRFRARVDWTLEASFIAAAAYIGIEVQSYADGMWSPGRKLTLRSNVLPRGPGTGLALGFGGKIPSVGGPGAWSEEFAVYPPMRTEDFRGLAGGVTVHPAINVGGTLAGGQLTLHLVLASGKRIDVGVDTGSSLGLGATLVTHYAGVWE